MTLKLLNVSQLAVLFGLDRGTVKNYLSDLKPYRESKNEKLYYSPVAVRLIAERKRGQTVDWSSVLLNGLKNGSIKIDINSPSEEHKDE